MPSPERHRLHAQHIHSSTYVFPVGLLCRGRRQGPVPGRGRNSSCSGCQKSPAPTHWSSAGRDSPGSWRPSGHSCWWWRHSPTAPANTRSLTIRHCTQGLPSNTSLPHIMAVLLCYSQKKSRRDLESVLSL